MQSSSPTDQGADTTLIQQIVPEPFNHSTGSSNEGESGQGEFDPQIIENVLKEDNLMKRQSDLTISLKDVENEREICSMMNTFDNCFRQKTKGDVMDHGILISGHRGGQSDKEPENTMHAFKAAIKSGLRSIEYDVSVQLFIPDSDLKILESLLKW